MIHWKLKYLIVSLCIIAAVSISEVVQSQLISSRQDLKIEDFAGFYFLGEDLEIVHTLVVKEDGSFRMEMISNDGYSRVFHGTMLTGEDRIYPNYKDSDISIEYILPVEWGDRRYLIPRFSDSTEDALAGFCRRVAAQEEPRVERYGWFYLQKDHWQHPTEGPPSTAWGASLCDDESSS